MKRKIRLIFKYHSCNEYLINIIKNSEIHFQDPKHFNDPYDCDPRIERLTEETLPDFIKSYQLDTVASNVSKALKYPKFLEFAIDMLMDSVNEFVRKFSVSCFSRRPDNLLMWGHYGSKHTGVCLGFDEELLNNTFGHGYDVEYQKKKPLVRLIGDADLIAKLIFSSKSSDWKYEKEVRFFQNQVGLVKFPKEALCQLIFGAKCSEDNMFKIAKQVESAGYPNLTFYKAETNTDSYKLLGQRLKFENRQD